MMPTETEKLLLVTYQLAETGKRNYEPLFEVLKGHGKWWHYLDSTWLLVTARSPNQVEERMRPHLGPTDLVLIFEVKRNYQGRLTKPAWEWIRERFDELYKNSGL